MAPGSASSATRRPASGCGATTAGAAAGGAGGSGEAIAPPASPISSGRDQAPMSEGDGPSASASRPSIASTQCLSGCAEGTR